MIAGALPTFYTQTTQNQQPDEKPDRDRLERSSQPGLLFSIASPPIVESILTIPLLNSANFDTIAVDAVRTALGKLAFGKDTLAPVDLSRVVLNSSAIQSLIVREKP